MIRNYIKIAFRNFIKNKLYISINIIGMALGIACAIVAFFNWDFHVNFDHQHKKHDDIVKVNTVRIIDGIEENHAISPIPLGWHAKNSLSAVKDYTRYIGRNGNVRFDDNVLSQNIGFVDSSFMNFFHFPLLKGTRTAIDNPNQIIITKKLQTAFFGQESSLDKTITLLLGNEKHEFLIGGVIEDHQLNSSFKFDLLMSIASYETLYKKENTQWSEMVDATFLQLAQKSDYSEVQKLMKEFIPPQNHANEEWKINKYYLTPFEEMADEARYLRSNRLGQNNPDGTIMIPTIMAVMILLIACFNFTNTSIAIAGNRIKEIGVRKALGAKRIQLQSQLLIESMIILSFSLILGMLIAEFLLPLYSSLGPWIDLHSNYSENLVFFLFLLSLVIGTGLLSAAYPALYISSFDVISIFRKKIKVKNTSWLTKSLLILQISFSLMAIIQGVVYVQNSTLQKEFDLGFNRSSIISIPLTEGSTYVGLKDLLSEISDINSVAVTNHHLGYSQSGGKFKTPNFEAEVRLFEVGPKYIDAMEIELLEGNNFHSNNDSSQASSIIVNQTLVDQFDIKDFSSPYTFDGESYQIIGVVKDFYPNGLWRGELNHPVVFRLSKENNYGFLIINVGSNDIVTADNKVQDYWKEFNPEIPYEGELNNKQVYLSELLSDNMTYFSFFQAVVASLLSITGLFTMVSLNIQNRMKEVSLRKIFGAPASAIFSLFNKQLLFILLIASAMGVTASYFLTDLFLDIMFSIHANVDFTTVLISLVSLLILTYLAVGYKLLIGIRRNPVDTLKQE